MTVMINKPSRQESNKKRLIRDGVRTHKQFILRVEWIFPYQLQNKIGCTMTLNKITCKGPEFFFNFFPQTFAFC